MPFHIRTFIDDQLAKGCERYVADLRALDESSRAKSPGGKARCAYDYSYEVAAVNRRIAARIKREDPGPWPFGEDWVTAPDEFRDLDSVCSEIEDSTKLLRDAWNSLRDEDFDQPVPIISGESTPIELAHLCATHMAYHGAQLNLIQAIAGDTAMHWED